MKITVVGCGYLGATHAACMAELGHEVLGMDTDIDKVHALQAGRAPFFEQGLDDLLARHTASGRLRFTASYSEAAAFADVHFLGVGTPQLPGENAYDLTALFTAVRRLTAALTRPALIVGKSTVPVGTSTRLAALIQETAPAGIPVALAWNPEFLRESHAIEDTLRPDRLVLGFQDGDTTSPAVLAEVYQQVLATGKPLISTDMATAELAKSAANAFLATKISFINAMAEVCEASGADVHQLAQALRLDPRIGHSGMRPGLGFGGGCLPKDIRGFMARAGELGADQALTFLREVDAINLRRRTRMVDLAREECDGTLRGKHITVWGAAFKPGTDDIRDSPALDVAEHLHRLGADVTVHDFQALDNALKAHPQLTYATDPAQACEGADLLLHLTEWPQYTDIDPATLTPLAASPRVLDGRDGLDPAQWREAGWTYRALGRP